jgi:hypothetical protein
VSAGEDGQLIPYEAESKRQFTGNVSLRVQEENVIALATRLLKKCPVSL